MYLSSKFRLLYLTENSTCIFHRHLKPKYKITISISIPTPLFLIFAQTILLRSSLIYEWHHCPIQWLKPEIRKSPLIPPCPVFPHSTSSPTIPHNCMSGSFSSPTLHLLRKAFSVHPILQYTSCLFPSYLISQFVMQHLLVSPIILSSTKIKTLTALFTNVYPMPGI